MPAATNPAPILRWSMAAVVLGGAWMFGGCAAGPQARAEKRPATVLSPTAEWVAPRAAWRMAEAFVREHPGCEVLVGSGDSMLPLYRDGTVLVVKPVAMADLRRSMTAVFIGDRGRPVAHVLTEKTSRGWRAMGVGNRERDTTSVRYDNLIGDVIRAYAVRPTNALASDFPTAISSMPMTLAKSPATPGMIALMASTPARGDQ